MAATLHSTRSRLAVLAAGIACLSAVLATPGQADPAGAYIVVFKDGVLTDGVLKDGTTTAERHGGIVGHRYDSAITGFSARLTDRQVRAYATDPAVDYVVPDTPVRAHGEQLDPPWGLDRIDQRRLPLDGVYRWNTEARKVTAYILDTGVRATHAEFEGRVSGGYDFVDDDPDPDDENGHGTIVAGIVGGKTFGVAKGVKIVPVRVLNEYGGGSTAQVIAGIDWITEHADGPAVVNVSLGGPANQALDDAVRRSIEAGVSYSVTGGSSNQPASNFSPARVREAITTAVVGRDDCTVSQGNYGPAIDIHAPGVMIPGPSHESDTGTVTMSGSSLATAHTSGAAALILGHYPWASPARVQAMLVRNGSPGVCDLPDGSPNKILYTGPFWRSVSPIG